MNVFYQPADIQNGVGITTDILRDWRRRGILTIGTNQNGRWVYSVGDVLMLSIVQFLVSRRLITDLADAFQVARVATQYVWSWLTPETNNPLAQGFRNIKCIAAWNVRQGDPLQVELFQDPANISKFKVPGYLVLDVLLVAKELENKVAFLFGNAENESPTS